VFLHGWVAGWLAAEATTAAAAAAVCLPACFFVGCVPFEPTFMSNMFNNSFTMRLLLFLKLLQSRF